MLFLLKSEIFLKPQEMCIPNKKRSHSTMEGLMQMTYFQRSLVLCKTQIQRNTSGFY